MRRDILVGLVALGVATSACSRAAQVSPETPAQRAIAQQSNLDRLWKAGTETAESPSEVVAAYGEPADRSVRAAPNRHTSATDSVIAMRYSSRNYVFLRSGANSRVFPALIEIADPDLQLTDAVQLGVTDDEALRLRFGTAMRQRRNGDTTFSVYARPSIEAQETMEIGMVNSTVVLVRWHPYVD